VITKYLLVWLLLATVAITNGFVRQFTYGKVVSDLAAHQISTITAIAGHPWPRLLADYNLVNGRVWAIFLVWVTVMPFVIFKISTRPA